MKKQRESNMELLRIVAMFFVMILHADFAALGQPNQAICHAEPWVTLFRYICEALSIVSVNVFILISGWYGIRPSVKGFSKFIFQVLFFSLLLFGVSCAIGKTTFSVSELVTAITLTHPLYWFVPAYIGLYILAPVLNAYIEKVDEKSLRRTVICWYVFQTIYGCIWLGDGQFQYGYSLVSFSGLYLLAQYLKRYGATWVEKSAAFHWSMYIALSIIICALGYAAAWWNIDGMQTQVLAYSNPLVVWASAELLLGFSKLSFSNKVVNIVAAGSFSVFLLHLNPWFYFDWFKLPIRQMADKWEPMAATGMIFLFLCGIYVVALLLDQIRALCWKPIGKRWES